MTGLLDFLQTGDSAVSALALFLDASAKGTIVLILALVISLGLRRASASARHFLWLLAVVSLIALPLASLVMPSWQWRVLPERILVVADPGEPAERDITPSGANLASTDIPSISPAVPSMDSPTIAVVSETVPPATSDTATITSAHSESAVGSMGTAPMPAPPRSVLISWSLWLLAAWFAGGTLVAIPCAISTIRVLKMTKQGMPPQGEVWAGLQQSLNERPFALRSVKLRLSATTLIPMTWGVIRPVILLPAEATSWTPERLRMVLLHEFAHIRRWDCLSQMIGQFACAIYWFNPLAWLAFRRMGLEREQACDDAVVTSGSKPSEYADQLFEIIRSLHPSRCGVVAGVAMARRTQIEGRLLAILDATRNRHHLTKRLLVFGLLATLAMTLPLGTMRLASRVQAEDATTPDLVKKEIESGADDASVGYVGDTAIAQAKRVAKREFIHDFRLRRPGGLQHVASKEDIRAAIQRCMKELGDTDRAVQEKGLEQLRYLGQEAFSDLVEGLHSRNSAVRKWCVVLLQSHGTSAVPHLSGIVRNDSGNWVRAAAASALGQTFSPEATPALLEALDDGDFHVRMSAIQGLMFLRDTKGFEPLASIVKNSNDDSQLRERAAEALISIDRGKARPVIEEAIAGESKDWIQHNFRTALQSTVSWPYWPPDSLDLRQLVFDASTLSGERFGDKEITELLKHIDSPNGTISSACLLALGDLHAEEAIPEIEKHIKNDPCCLRSLASIGSVRAVDIIVEALQSPDAKTRTHAVEALGTHGGKWAVPLLMEMLDDPELRITHSGEHFLAGIDGFSGVWPDEHRAHVALSLCLGRAGQKGTAINLATGKQFFVDEEIKRLKAWWNDHGEEFLNDIPVPNPDISSVHLIS